MTFSIFKNKFIIAVCYAFVFLFVYAAISKGLDFQQFSLQLQQSPILTNYSLIISWSIPSIEIIVAFLLVTYQFRLLGLYLSFSLMLVFSTYIILILNSSDHIPCSCGGILEKMSWSQHLIFNLFFVGLALIAILFLQKKKLTLKSNLKTKLFFSYWIIIAISLGSVGSLVLLYYFSRFRTNQRQNFQRYFAESSFQEIKQIKLDYNSYYLAGLSDSLLFLGNNSAPLYMKTINTHTWVETNYQVKIDEDDLPFRAVKIQVKPPYFYVFDGTVPCIFRGKISDWNAKLIMKNEVYFSLIQPIAKNQFVFRTISTKSNENILGNLRLSKDSSSVILHPTLLQKQVDGIFGTDGTLNFDERSKTVNYIYRYRNQIIFTDSDLNLDHYGHTIDTNTRTKIKIGTIKSKQQQKLLGNSLLINRTGFSYNGLLFNNSALLGEFEDKRKWKNSSVIDIYDLSKDAYLFSFYIPTIKGHKIQGLIVKNDLLISITENQLQVFRIDQQQLNAIKENKVQQKNN